MSWFSITQDGKQLWDSHFFINGLITGGIVGRLIMDNGLKKTTFYPFLRDKISTSLALSFAEKVTPYNKIIATKILEESINQEGLAQLKVKLKEKLKHLTKDDLYWVVKYSFQALKIATKSATYGAYNYLTRLKLVKNIFLEIARSPKNSFFLPKINPFKNINLGEQSSIPNNIADEQSQLTQLLKNGEISEFVCKAAILNLHPTLEKGVKAVMASAAKAGIALSIDLGVKKIITIASLPLLYGLVRSAFQLTADNLPENQLTQTFSSATDYMPSMSTVMWGSAAMHVGFAGYSFWKLFRNSSTHPKTDKKDVEELILKLSKNSIIRKIDENPLLRKLEITLDETTKEKLSQQLIHHVVDFYWPKFSRTKFLGIPLTH